MTFRTMDEAADLAGRGLVLFVNEGDAAAFADGCRIRDIRGNVHNVARAFTQDGLTCLLLEGADFAYFERLFNDVRVDATLFELLGADA